MKRPADAAGGSIGQQVGSALDSLVQPVQSVVDSVRETVAGTVSGMAGFMKEPSDTMSRRTESALRTVAAVVSPKPSGTRPKLGTAAARLAKPAARKTTSRKPAVARARSGRQH